MRKKLILLFMYVNRFGLIKGLQLIYKNYILKKGVSSFSLNSKKIHLRRSTSDIDTFNQIFLKLEYRFDLKFQPEFIVDCGANIGLAAVYFKSVFPGAQIVSIEPEESNFEMLKKNTFGYDNFEAVRAGVWNKNAILRVTDEYSMGNWGFICQEVTEEDENTTKAISIEEIMHRYNRITIDILKIDIEGAELELFSSGYDYWLPRTKVIVIELHDWLRKGTSKAFFSALLKYNFSIYQSGENTLCIQE